MEIPEFIKINNDFYLSHSPSDQDLDALVNCLNDTEIYNNTLRVPHPYTIVNAQEYVKGCMSQKGEHQKPMKWQIRNKDGLIVGSIALHNQYGKGSHKDEIGYWIGKSYRNKGLMAEAINIFTAFVMENYGLIRLEATIFDFNVSSQKMIEKCNFRYEGTLKKAYFKDGKFIDGKLYALVK
jgi:RimJ/RimL family protein N-acetyltransferase